MLTERPWFESRSRHDNLYGRIYINKKYQINSTTNNIVYMKEFSGDLSVVTGLVTDLVTGLVTGLIAPKEPLVFKPVWF